MAIQSIQEALSANLVVPTSTFQVTFTPISGTFLFFINGVFQSINTDYLLSANNIFTTTLIPTAYNVRVAYNYIVPDPPIVIRGSTQEVLINNAVSATSLFTLSHVPLTGSLLVFINGVQQAEYTNFNIINTTIAFTALIGLGNIVSAKYDYAASPPSILPDGVQGSTNLNPAVTAFDPLLVRIKHSLGWPIIEIEMCDDMIYDFINQAIEWYSKYAGYTEEFLIFNSEIYSEPGLQIDKLFTITPTMRTTLVNGVSVSYDYDLASYRKVIGVFDVEQGESTGINTLFTLEQAMAQQTYFSYMLGNVGFDLVTWEVLKQWLDLREKVLAQKIYVDFDNRTQLLRLIPPPTPQSRFYGIVGCFVERPIKHLILERWVYQYSLALTKIAIGNIRGKYAGVQLFGGGSLDYQNLLSQGLEEKLKLEDELMNHYGECIPARFFIG